MAWLWSKIHLRFAVAEGRAARRRSSSATCIGSFEVYIDETGAPHARRRRAHSRRARRVERITAEDNRATGIVLADGTRGRADAVIAAVPSVLFKKLAPPLTPDYDRAARRTCSGRAPSACRHDAGPPALAHLLDEHRRPHDAVPGARRAHELHRPGALRRQSHRLHLELPDAGPRVLRDGATTSSGRSSSRR